MQPRVIPIKLTSSQLSLKVSHAFFKSTSACVLCILSLVVKLAGRLSALLGPDHVLVLISLSAMANTKFKFALVALAVAVAGAATSGADLSVNLESLFGPHVSPGTEIASVSESNFSTVVGPRWSSWQAPTYFGAIKPATESDVQNIVTSLDSLSIQYGA